MKLNWNFDSNIVLSKKIHSLPAGIIKFSSFLDEVWIDDHLMQKRKVSFKVFMKANVIVTMS